MTGLLTTKGVTLTYGNSATALIDVSIEAKLGATIAILGGNGAGKTSLVRALTGQFPFYGATLQGTITYDGQSIETMSAPAIARLGIVQVPEGRKLFPNLSVRENLICGASPLGNLPARKLKGYIDEVIEIFPKLKRFLDAPAGYLSGGEQQMTAIGRAIMARPKVLLCDELSLGLAPIIIRDIYNTLARLKQERGMSLLIIEQNARQALKLADYAYILEVGQIVFQGSAEEIRGSDRIAQYYLGGS